MAILRALKSIVIKHYIQYKEILSSLYSPTIISTAYWAIAYDCDQSRASQNL